MKDKGRIVIHRQGDREFTITIFADGGEELFFSDFTLRVGDSLTLTPESVIDAEAL